MNLIEINRHVHQAMQADVSVSVTEKRAPTDASVALLREMEAAAKASVIASVRVVDCPVDIVVHAQDDNINDVRLYRVIYSVNGIRRVVDTHTNSDATKQAQALKLIDVLSADIAVSLLTPHLTKAIGS